MYVLSWRELFLRSLECYFGVYFPRCFATREINTKITLSWVLKQFVTYIILYIFRKYSHELITANFSWTRLSYMWCHFYALACHHQEHSIDTYLCQCIARNCQKYYFNTLGCLQLKLVFVHIFTVIIICQFLKYYVAIFYEGIIAIVQ